MRLPIFAVSVSTLPGTAAAAQTQAVPSASSRPQEAAITAAPLPCREEAVTFDAAHGVRLSTPVSGPSFRNSLARRDASSPSARGLIHRRMGRGSSE
jgi:hypothetical protein